MKISKTIAALLSLSFSMVSVALPAHAETFGRTSSGHSFSDDWEVTDDLTVREGSTVIKVGECVYGFDKRAILSDQDYAKCYIVDHKAKTHVAPGGGVIAGSSAWSYPSTWTSVVKCAHSGYSCTYYFESYGIL